MSRRFISLLVLLVSLSMTTGAFARAAEVTNKKTTAGNFDSMTAEGFSIADYDSIMTHAKMNLYIARDPQAKTVHEEYADWLITDASQFSSPYGTKSEGYRITGDANALFNEYYTWRSEWENGPVPMDYHYLQVELTKTTF